MHITKRANNNYISSIATQKEIENFLLHHYCIPRQFFRNAVSAGRKAGHLFTDIETCGKVIVVYIVPRKMFIGICPREMYVPDPEYKI